MLRTHTCGELRKENSGKEIVLAGWADSIREHGKITFINIRDRYGVTQVTFNGDINIPELKKITKESVIGIKGKVKERPSELVNKDMNTGEIEVIGKEITIYSISEKLPLDMSGQVESNEETRLKYRYLDLRNKENMGKLIFRNEVMKEARLFLDKQGFTEVTTPLLVKSTPEGARDYVVPSRVNKGEFYALPQSPQLYKQILMIAGFDKYFQFAPCLRDEDLRHDRQPEHTQIDMEMSFVELKDMFKLFEKMFFQIFEKKLGVKLALPFTRLSYAESMEKYGTDKPDLRFELLLKDTTEIFEKTDFKVFKDIIGRGVIKAINPPKQYSRKEIDKLTGEVKAFKAKGLAYVNFTNGTFDGGITKFLSEEEKQKLISEIAPSENSTIFFGADCSTVVNNTLGYLRNKFGKELGLYDKKEFKFCFVKDFPLFEWDPEENKYIPCHHMFCMPLKEHIDIIESNPGDVICTQYDLVLNGVELGSGSMRINNPELQKRIMKVIGFSEEEAEEKFGFLLEAYRYGGPPHGGIGLGFDRIVALMLGTTDIREVIPFPKNKKAQCPMDGSPSKISKEQMDELGLKN